MLRLCTSCWRWNFWCNAYAVKSLNNWPDRVSVQIRSSNTDKTFRMPQVFNNASLKMVENDRNTYLQDASHLVRKFARYSDFSIHSRQFTIIKFSCDLENQDSLIFYEELAETLELAAKIILTKLFTLNEYHSDAWVTLYAEITHGIKEKMCKREKGEQSWKMDTMKGIVLVAFPLVLTKSSRRNFIIWGCCCIISKLLNITLRYRQLTMIYVSTTKMHAQSWVF